MIVTPATVVFLTLAFVTALIVGFLPFVIHKDEDLRMGVLLGAVAVIGMFVLGLGALAADFDHSLNDAKTLERSCPR